MQDNINVEYYSQLTAKVKEGHLKSRALVYCNFLVKPSVSEICLIELGLYALLPQLWKTLHTSDKKMP